MDFNLATLGSLLAATEGGHHGASFWGLIGYFVLVLAIVFIVLSAAKRSFGQRIFKTWPAQIVEQVYVFVENLCVGTIGPHGRKYIPMIMTLWLVIFTGNVIALFFATSPTADLSFNLAMALIAVGYVQWEGIKANGAWGHFKHFAGPKLGGFLALIVTPMIFVIEIISEVMKNMSLSLRLFGNIDGGHQAAEALNTLTADYYVPLGAILLPLKLLTVLVQALIFCLLTCVYLSLVTSHDHGDDHAHAEPAHAH
jgi:F-type H+-transporting ATPase subunit a